MTFFETGLLLISVQNRKSWKFDYQKNKTPVGIVDIPESNFSSNSSWTNGQVSEHHTYHE